LVGYTLSDNEIRSSQDAQFSYKSV